MLSNYQIKGFFNRNPGAGEIIIAPERQGNLSVPERHLLRINFNPLLTKKGDSW